MNKEQIDKEFDKKFVNYFGSIDRQAIKPDYQEKPQQIKQFIHQQKEKVINDVILEIHNFINRELKWLDVDEGFVKSARTKNTLELLELSLLDKYYDQTTIRQL